MADVLPNAPTPPPPPLPDGDVLAEHRDYAICLECDGPLSLDEADSNAGMHSACDPDAGVQ